MTVFDDLRDRARRRFRQHQQQLLSTDTEWVALTAAEGARLTATAAGDDDSLDQWLQAVRRRSDIENTVPLPWYERLGRRYDGYKFLVALYLARAERRADILSVDRSRIPANVWKAGGRLAASLAAAWTLQRRPPELIDNLDWPEWQEILTYSDDPPHKCREFALGERPDGCFPECSQPHKGKVRCLAPRGDALGRLKDLPPDDEW